MKKLNNLLYFSNGWNQLTIFEFNVTTKIFWNDFGQTEKIGGMAKFFGTFSWNCIQWILRKIRNVQYSLEIWNIVPKKFIENKKFT